MTGKRVVFTGGTGKAGRHILPHLLSRGYDLLNVDLKPFDHPFHIALGLLGIAAAWRSGRRPGKEDSR